MVAQDAITIGEPEIVEGAPMTFAGMKLTFTPETMHFIPGLWNRFEPRIGTVPGETGDAAFGVVIDLCTADPEIDYVVVVQVRSTANLPDDLTVVEAPARLFAVFPFEEHVSRLGETVNAIWERWLPSSDYEKDIVPGAPDLVERYGLGFDPATGKGDITIWIPIKPLPN